MIFRAATLMIAALGTGMGAGMSLAQEAAPASSVAPAYDPTRFLETMVNYRKLALTCEDSIPGSPMADSAEISVFFQTLGMAEPLTIDRPLERLTKRLVRSQSASVCTERLQEGAMAYGREAVIYTTNKPSEWPAAPQISTGPWCRTETCAELSF